MCELADETLALLLQYGPTWRLCLGTSASVGRLDRRQALFGLRVLIHSFFVLKVLPLASTHCLSSMYSRVFYRLPALCHHRLTLPLKIESWERK